MTVDSGDAHLQRRLGLSDAVVVGLGSMLGAGIFAALGPAAAAAGSGLLLGLGAAAIVAYCNATSSARLAARYPQSGGTYVYGRERLGALWGYLAGWSFVVGKTASCAAMALTVGAYAWPTHARAIAVAATVIVTTVNYRGVRKTALLTRVIVAIVLAVLAVVVALCLSSGEADASRLGVTGGAVSVHGVLQAAGFLFFAFAGYARIATLGEEVRDPARTIPRAISIALGIALAVYASVAVAVLGMLGVQRLGASTAPLVDAVRAAVSPDFAPIVQVGAAVASLGSLLALVLGVSRTTLAMARNRHLPHALSAVHERFGVPHRAELAVGAVVVIVAMTADVRGAIGFSSFGVLVYYAIANAAAMTLSKDEGRPARVIPIAGLLGCVVIAGVLPWSSSVTGAAVLVVGAAGYEARRRMRRSFGQAEQD